MLVEKVIMIKYGELSTKKDNINMFLKQLKDNVKFALAAYDVDVKFDKGRMFITLSKDNFIWLLLYSVPNITEISIFIIR